MPSSAIINKWVRLAGCLVILLGIAALAISPTYGPALSPRVWLIEPLAYVGAATIITGLVIVALSYFIPRLLNPSPGQQALDRRTSEAWGNLTLQYFELFQHDLGRPLRRILGKERELRALLQAAESDLYPQVKSLLDEIEGQAPNFRLMMSNVQVLVQMEAPDSPALLQPVEPAEVVRRIVDRYTIVAADSHKAITWWAEPAGFGIVYCDSSAIEHIVTNLVDNSVRYATGQVEISLTKSPSNFYVRVWDDGPGIAAPYRRPIFTRGWTPEVARREERTTSGLGLFIARTLATRYHGQLTVDSVTEPDPDHHTAFTLSLPLADPPEE